MFLYCYLLHLRYKMANDNRIMNPNRLNIDKARFYNGQEIIVDYADIEFPVSITDNTIKNEKQNQIRVNLFRYKEKEHKFFLFIIQIFTPTKIE